MQSRKRSVRTRFIASSPAYNKHTAAIISQPYSRKRNNYGVFRMRNCRSRVRVRKTRGHAPLSQSQTWSMYGRGLSHPRPTDTNARRRSLLFWKHNGLKNRPTSHNTKILIPKSLTKHNDAKTKGIVLRVPKICRIFADVNCVQLNT